MKNKPNYIEKLAMNIVYQIGDLLEAPVEKRQATNDQAIDFVMKLLDGVLEEQAAGFEALIGEDEDEGTIIAEKGMDSEDVRSRFIFIWSRNSFRRQLREQLKGMRGK